MWLSEPEALLDILLRCVVCFVGLIVLLRLGGKRTLTKMNAFDFVMTFALGSTLASVITSTTLSVSEGMLALATLIALQYVIAWLEVRSERFQRWVKSEPSVLFHRGEFCRAAMRRERITEIEVLAAMRYSGLADPSEAELVLMETDGQLSVIPSKPGQSSYGTMRSIPSFAATRDKLAG